MKYELKIDGNILKTDDKDIALEFVRAMARPVTVPYIPPIVIEREPHPWPWTYPVVTWGNTIATNAIKG